MNADLFWAHVNALSADDCWEWQAFRDRDGYGRAWVDGKMLPAHRVAFELANNTTLTADQEVCHKCDNPPCCNPHHLFLGTHKDNMLDMAQKKRARTLSTHGRITKAIRQAIRADHATETFTYAELARKYDVHISTVIRLCK